MKPTCQTSLLTRFQPSPSSFYYLFWTPNYVFASNHCYRRSIRALSMLSMSFVPCLRYFCSAKQKYIKNSSIKITTTFCANVRHCPAHRKFSISYQLFCAWRSMQIFTFTLALIRPMAKFQALLAFHAIRKGSRNFGLTANEQQKKAENEEKTHTQIRTMEKCQVWIGKPSGKPKGWFCFCFCWWNIYLRFLPSFWAAIPPIVIVSGVCFGPFRRYGGWWWIYKSVVIINNMVRFVFLLTSIQLQKRFVWQIISIHMRQNVNNRLIGVASWETEFDCENVGSGLWIYRWFAGLLADKNLWRIYLILIVYLFFENR